ncbi:hypothetical protein PTQ19_10100 [Microbacterium esteraromaticum]|uniref:hypothetical protein n=1 Tax=Microbacterium esteraromaticum TaxID=57043 RepID=UPI0023682F89|nr:hypothetical protein [Microbacterium esteraromaticum]WDH77872.1 hypothetical protein PTQ19_10100 [Microbacterium esteraromaticum]
MSITENPTLLVVEKGAANLAGKRRLTDDMGEAAEFADAIGGQVFELEPVEPAPYVPLAAVQHVSVDGDLLTSLPLVVVSGNTSWPAAMPEIIDLPHAVNCDACIGAGDSYIDIECPCAYVGDAPAVSYSYSVVRAHCPECGRDHECARDPEAA